LRRLNGSGHGVRAALKRLTPITVELRDFDPRKPGTMTNAGEAVSTLVQSSVDCGSGLAHSPGFEPCDARGARAYVRVATRPQRPMESLGWAQHHAGGA
jgi:hypothetical protein